MLQSQLQSDESDNLSRQDRDEVVKKLDAAIVYQKELRDRIVELYTKDAGIKEKVVAGAKAVQSRFRRKMEIAERRHGVYRVKLTEGDVPMHDSLGFNFVWECVKTFLKDRLMITRATVELHLCLIYFFSAL